ncbi:16S rRNA (guanine(966)-N(2))-methyltransferase RsmD [Thioalkalivibrio denitrificans]|uniref:Ribosomal RNA small subunit methyltransferase D n=1 Tax=Thioalkalivibrio denitrificans TaxID=108003 RepID=A0A1V3NDQ5_9GAMM|nr:16S rRNA (guanine(966)-N(2))-methyltransferase RsmD [Thioalkalivibrio denitrificans]
MRHQGKSAAPRPGTPGRLRIVAGAWRGRRIAVPSAAGLRPTPDRVRETLFNWLQGVVPGARCLDLFAGAGGLGFEAASRGAARVVMVESAARVATHLREQVQLLEAGDRIEVVADDALRYLRRCDETFDLVFLDPPFQGDLLDKSLAALVEAHCLRAGARVYVEYAASGEPPVLPDGWEIAREGRAGDSAHLLTGPIESPSF